MLCCDEMYGARNRRARDGQGNQQAHARAREILVTINHPVKEKKGKKRREQNQGRERGEA